VDDPEAAYDATQLTIDGVGFGWRLGDPRIDPPRNSHVHIAAASNRTRFVFKDPRAFTTRQGTATFDPIGIVVTSDDEAIQAAIDAGGGLLNGDSVLISEEVASTWKVEPASLKRAERYENNPYISGASAQTGIGGTIPENTTRYYRIAVWDGFQWSQRSNEKEVTTGAEQNESGIVLAILPRSINSKVRVWWGSESNKYGAYCDITVPTSNTRIYDTGDYLSGLAWITEEPPTPPTTNAQQTLVDLAGNRVLFSDAEEENEEEELEPVKPADGEWKQGDICLRTNPEAGGIVGFICVESGEPGMWKAFGTITE